MQFNHLFMLIKKAILHKRQNLREANELVRGTPKSPSGGDKREQLKKIYKEILTGTPYAENIPMFMQMIDQVPEDYLEYELGIDLQSAMKMIQNLIHGKGNFTQQENENLRNITSGIGIPAIEHHAMGGKAMSKEQQAFGSYHMNKNVKEFNQSVEKRNAKLPLSKKPKQLEAAEDNPEEKPVESEEHENVPTEEELKSWIRKHPDFEDEVLHAWVKEHKWNIHEVEDMIYELATDDVQNEEMNLGDYLLCEEAKKKIYQILEGNFRSENYYIRDNPELMKKVMEKYKGASETPHKSWADYDEYKRKYGGTEKDIYTRELLPTKKLSDQEKKELVKQIRLLRILRDKKGLEQVLNHLNQKRRSYNLPQLTMQGLKNATRVIGRPGPSVQSGDVNWQQHMKDAATKEKYKSQETDDIRKIQKKPRKEIEKTSLKRKFKVGDLVQDNGEVYRVIEVYPKGIGWDNMVNVVLVNPKTGKNSRKLRKYSKLPDRPDEDIKLWTPEKKEEKGEFQAGDYVKLHGQEGVWKIMYIPQSYVGKTFYVVEPTQQGYTEEGGTTRKNVTKEDIAGSGGRDWAISQEPKKKNISS